MPELIPLSNTACQDFLLGILNFNFKFYCLLLEKKAYPIDFSFKFNEIK